MVLREFFNKADVTTVMLFLLVFFFGGTKIEPRTSHMKGIYFLTELHPYLIHNNQPVSMIFTLSLNL